MEGHAPHDPTDETRKLLPVVVPLVAPDFNLLPLHFAVDPGEEEILLVVYVRILLPN